MSITQPRRIRGFLAVAFALATVVFVVQPAAADFTPPNTPKLTKFAEVTAATGATTSFYDHTNGVIHVLGESTLTAYNSETLAVEGLTTLSSGETFSQQGNTFDPETGTVFATRQVAGPDQLQAWKYLPADDQYTIFDLNIAPARTVVYSTEANRVYAIDTAANGTVEPSVAVAGLDVDTGIWTPRPTYTSIDIGGDNTAIQDVVATSTGWLVGTYLTTGTGGPGPNDSTITRKSLFSFADNGDTLVPTEIPGSAFSPATIPYPTDQAVGYSQLTPKPGGGFTATEMREAATRKMTTVIPSADPSGFSVDPTAITLGFQPAFTTFEVGGGLYLASSDTVTSFVSGAPFASSDAGPQVRELTGGDGQAYALTGASDPYKLSIVKFGGYSPTITLDPASEGVFASAGETKSITLHSGGTGTPDPTVRWQKLSSGESTWNDISGATSPDVSFGVTTADDGSSYRAVYSNVAGEIATSSALISVGLIAAPPITPNNPIGPPAPAAPQVKNGKSVKLKFKKGKSVKVTVGTVTCASTTTCVYTLPASIKFKIGTKTFKAKVVGPATLEPGKSQAIIATVPASAIKALKGKKSKLTVSVKVANTAGKMHSMAMSIISKISA